jgi:hypothetical protein
METSGVGSGGTLHRGRVGERGQYHHAHVGVTFGDLGNGGDAISGADMNVQGNEIRLEPPDQGETIGDVRHMRDGLEVGLS